MGGLLAGPLFTLVYLLEGALREGYSAWRNPVSSLALGKHGWVQVVNFLTTGGLLVGFGLGARRVDPTATWPPRLIGAVGVGLVGAGFFACDPIGGYPPGTPPRPTRPSATGALHQLFSSFLFFSLPALFVQDARQPLVQVDRARDELDGAATQRQRKTFWGAYSAATCAAFLSSFALSSAGFGQAPGIARVGGLFQRVALSSGFLWLSLRAARMLRNLDSK
jgi:hypothetical protein